MYYDALVTDHEGGILIWLGFGLLLLLVNRLLPISITSIVHMLV